jgi:hypothetical protein
VCVITDVEQDPGVRNICPKYFKLEDKWERRGITIEYTNKMDGKGLLKKEEINAQLG